jgi:hypothetical protein
LFRLSLPAPIHLLSPPIRSTTTTPQASFIEPDKADEERALRLPSSIHPSITIHEYHTRIRDCLPIDFLDNLSILRQPSLRSHPSHHPPSLLIITDRSEHLSANFIEIPYSQHQLVVLCCPDLPPSTSRLSSHQFLSITPSYRSYRGPFQPQTFALHHTFGSHVNLTTSYLSLPDFRPSVPLLRPITQFLLSSDSNTHQ